MFVNSNDSIASPSSKSKDRDICMQEMGIDVVSHRPITDKLSKPLASESEAYDNPAMTSDE